MIYTNGSRGTIQFRDRKRQIIDFSNLRIGTITPTDCDGLIEYHNKAYVIFEIKYRDAEVPHGQLEALVRSIDDYKQAGKAAVLIIAEHTVDDTTRDIDAAKCNVRSWYTGKWKRPNSAITLGQLVEQFIAFVDRSKP